MVPAVIVALLVLLALVAALQARRRRRRDQMAGAQLDALGMVWGAPRMAREADDHYRARLRRIAPHVPTGARVGGRLIALSTPRDREIGR